MQLWQEQWQTTWIERTPWSNRHQHHPRRSPQVQRMQTCMLTTLALNNFLTTRLKKRKVLLLSRNLHQLKWIQANQLCILQLPLWLQPQPHFKPQSNMYPTLAMLRKHPKERRKKHLHKRQRTRGTWDFQGLLTESRLKKKIGLNDWCIFISTPSLVLNSASTTTIEICVVLFFFGGSIGF